MKGLADGVTLNNGVTMPWLGLGVYKTQEGTEVEHAVRAALELGYRSIDTAALYQNELGVGRAIRESGIARETLFVTTKVWNSNQGYELTLRAFEESLEKLSMDYVDLYLIHWPVKGKYKETWKALEKIYRDGRAKAIGVSNFHVHHLQDLMESSEVVPAVNQVEYHPYLQQVALLAFCNQQQIWLEAWSPLARGGEVLHHPVIAEIARNHGKSPAQVILRWDLQKGVVTIPKSIHTERIRENSEVFDFELTPQDMSKIAELNLNKRIGPDPDNFDF